MDRKLVCGIGINDSDYVVKVTEEMGYTGGGKRLRKLVWICPYYRTWFDMINRCYNVKSKTRESWYEHSSVDERWHRFSVFRAWMVNQRWCDEEGNKFCLDKDILANDPNIKVYSPETCCFVPTAINVFVTERSLGASGVRGVLKVGDKYRAQSGNGKVSFTIGIFNTVEEAYNAWLEYKQQRVAEFSEVYKLENKVKEALELRYKGGLM